ncbi:MAG: fumarylacetoacetate hydrolase family protein [Alphaproteobacteria bacterium]|nr:fumarylacetoacetate hydrolase family protein [Alphaproteobacteria bacterium]MBV9154452.1 fumarylacetoacetate hydrolase family protein [Alphaproteobacteria bacterium]MBV9585396.1 fumarylacetoacetate hydrolase family protein [Alphaproteobacteria bacterium]
MDIRQKAERIATLFRDRRQIDILPSELIPADLDEAYAVRRDFEVIERARGRGEIVGYKIGLTTPIMQKLCGVDEPCYGAIFATELHRRRAELPVSDYCRLGIETEIAVRLGENLPQGAGRDRVAAAVESCMAAIEVLEDLRQDYNRLSAAAMVAGNVWNAGAVIGAPVADWRKIDLAAVTARLTINRREIGHGRGADVMGNPLNALAWLADKLAAVGTPLRRGMIVLTGSMVPIQFPAAGDHAVVEIEDLGTAELVTT